MSDSTQVRDLAPYPGTVTIQAPIEAEAEARALPLSHYVWLLKRHRWKISIFIFASLVSTYLVSKRLTRVYEAYATIDVDRQVPTGVLGQEAAAIQAAPNDADQFMATQIGLIQSDSVLRPVVEKLRLKENDPDYADTVK